ncbi:MAG TPA: LysM peptidoglycan-binding domain-containing protein [Candidatus Sumerlaeota bacterium]|nr:LysM peptidoglycan-binding domain-containing protein [Candidatus Sumerlaeota bacterium]HPS00055.1 LysM peptidoglycan-binding domain-containing protein [Candidatus Sumerlaeota bacterium]
MKSLVSLVSIGLMVLIFSACNVNPERSESFIKLSKRVDALEKSYKDIQNGQNDLYEQLSQIRKSVEASQAAGGTGGGADPAALTAALQRIEQLEKKIGLVENQLALQQKGGESKPTAKAPAKEAEPAVAPDATLQPPTPGGAPAVVPKSVTDGKAAKKTDAKKSAEKSAEKPAEKASSASTKGSYYTIQSGDTLESIASKNGVTVQQLKDENHLTNGAKLLGGQQLFIPKK